LICDLLYTVLYYRYSEVFRGAEDARELDVNKIRKGIFGYKVRHFIYSVSILKCKKRKIYRLCDMKYSMSY
jgi:hypothetical protein